MAAHAALWPLDDVARSGVERLLEQLAEIDDTTGGFTTKSDLRQTGMSLHVKFDKKVDVLATTMPFLTMLERSPALLANACRRLLAADDAAKVST